MSIAYLADRAIKVRSYDQFVTYDDRHTKKEGYWICAGCQVAKAKNAFINHETGCRLRTQMAIHAPEIIYVTGPSDEGAEAPFNKKDFPRIKKAAETALLFQKIEDKLFKRPFCAALRIVSKL